MSIKKSLSAVTLALGMTGATLTMAQSLAHNAVTNAGEVIDAVLEAYGGAKAIRDLNSVLINNKSSNVAVGQSRKPDAPYDRDKTEGMSYVNYSEKIFANHNVGSGGGNEFEFGTVINGENSYNFNHLSRRAAPLAEPDFNTTSGPLVRITTPLLVKQLQERRHTSHWLGVDDVDGRPHDVITLVMEVGPGLSLYFDQETRMLNKSERILPPFGVVEYRFRNHKNVDDISFNTEFELLLNGEHNLDRKITGIAVNTPSDKHTAVPQGFQIDAPIPNDDMSTSELDDGVFLVGGGGAYSLFVEMDDYIFAAGATLGVAARIEELRKSVPKKPVRYGLLTHHHSDHIPGAADYMAAKATLLTVSENETVVRSVVGDDAKLEYIEGQRTISDGKRTIEVRNIGPTPHADNLLVVYLPAEGIVFEADHFSLPRNGTIPPATNNARALAKAVSGWKFDHLVGAHSPAVAKKSDLMNAVATQVTVR